MASFNWPEMMKAINALLQYKSQGYLDFRTPRDNLINSLSLEDERLVGDLWIYKDAYVGLALDQNAVLADAIADYSKQFLTPFGLESFLDQGFVPNESDHAIVRSTIRQFWRDWSDEGYDERSACHMPVQNDLMNQFAGSPRSNVRVLVPGAGLGRLAYNLAALGYDVEAIDVSHIQLLATNFILSRNHEGTDSGSETLNSHAESDAVSQYKIYPFATQFSNHLLISDQFETCKVPDECPARYLGGAPVIDASATSFTVRAPGLKLCAKDFTLDFKDAASSGSFDAVTTVFFVDTAKNFLEYARAAHHVLKTGGVWVNIGPLLWNCYELGPGGRREGDVDADEDNRSRLKSAGRASGGLDVEIGKSWDAKIELSNEEVLILLVRMGFRITKCEIMSREVGYIQDPRSLLQNKYRLAHWVAEKL